MSLVSIAGILKSKGYTTRLSEIHNVVHCLILNNEGHPIFERSSQVRLIDGKYHHIYFRGNRDIWNIFEKEEEVIAYILKNYPLNEEETR